MSTVSIILTNYFQTGDNFPVQVPVIFQAGKKEKRGRNSNRFPLALVSTSHNLMRTLGLKMKAAQATEWSKPCATVIKVAKSSFIFSTTVCFGGFNYN